jgi:hypothetical protein
MNAILPKWPRVVLGFETFLRSAGLVCQSRDDPKSIYDDKSFVYSDGKLAVEVSMTAEDGWRIQLADLTTTPLMWYVLETIRILLKGSAEAKLPFAERFSVMEASWPELKRRFGDECKQSTHLALRTIQNRD